MKKLVLIMAILGSQILSAKTTGGWFKFSDNNSNIVDHELTITDLKMVSYDIERGMTQANTWYNLPSGGRFQMPYPQEWFNLTLKNYQKLDNSVTRENLSEKISKDEIVTWNSDMAYRVKNYSHETSEITSTECEGSQFLKMGTRVVVHNGNNSTIKTSCGNPLEVLTSSSQTITASNGTTRISGVGTNGAFDINLNINCSGCNQTETRHKNPGFYDDINSEQGYGKTTGVRNVNEYYEVWDVNRWIIVPWAQILGRPHRRYREPERREYANNNQGHRRDDNHYNPKPDNGNRYSPPADKNQGNRYSPQPDRSNTGTRYSPPADNNQGNRNSPSNNNGGGKRYSPRG